MFEWTVHDFVREMCLNGAADRDVLAVARCTRWDAKRTEVKDWLQRRGERWRKRALRQKEESCIE